MNCQYLFQKVLKFTQLPSRSCTTARKGIEYYGFTYYPRTENFQDPPYEPSKLFLVRRIKTMKGLNSTERKSLALLNIDGKPKQNGDINVVKNIPEINKILWNVKHLVEIRPITYKGELPKDGDYSGTHLRLTGELVITPRLNVSQEQLQATEDFHKSVQLKRNYLRDYLKKVWLNGYNGGV